MLLLSISCCIGGFIYDQTAAYRFQSALRPLGVSRADRYVRHRMEGFAPEWGGGLRGPQRDWDPAGVRGMGRRGLHAGGCSHSAAKAAAVAFRFAGRGAPARG